MNLVLRIVAGVLVPSFATIIFNILSFFVENYHTSPLPRPNETVFEVAVGCTFALFGIGIGAEERNRGERLIIVSVLLMLTIIGVEILAPLFLQWPKFYSVLIMDTLAILALSWGIVETNYRRVPGLPRSERKTAHE
ncbi:MAG: hypothetical protein AB7H71_03545 [Alphaproteobacteria bacterium]